MGVKHINTVAGAGPVVLSPPVHPLVADGYKYPEPTRLYLQAQTGASQFRVGDHSALGPELVTNGAMAADTDWTKGTGWTIAAGVASSSGAQSANSDLVQDTDDTGAELIEGEVYTVVFTATRSAGNVRAVLGGTAGTNRSSAATFTENLVCGADGTIVIRADLDFIGTIDDVSVKKAVLAYDATPPQAANGTSPWHLAAGISKDIPVNANSEVTVVGADSNAILQYYWE